MSESQNRNYSKYDDMTTEELEEILRLDASALEGEDSDTELLLYVMGVLANRRKNNGTGKTAQQAWEFFQQNYLTEVEESSENIQEHNAVRLGAPWLRRLIAAAAVIVLVICIPVTANAFGWEDIWEIFARWAKETFSFVTDDSAVVSEPSPEYDSEYASLQDVLRANNREADIVPTWIPDGFVLDSLEKDITPIQEIYWAFYVNGDNELKIRVKNYIATDAYNVEIEEELLEIYTVSGTEYYLFKNVDQLRAVWIIDSYECNISGDISIEEIKKMIDSIWKG